MNKLSEEIIIGKYLKVKIIERKPVTNVWGVYSRRSGDCLGVIKWYAPWRGYCFVVDVIAMYKDGIKDLVYSTGCMDDINNFIKKVMSERKRVKIRCFTYDGTIAKENNWRY